MTSTILIVEDDVYNRDILSEILEEAGDYEIVIVEHGQAALHWLQHNPKPDLMLLDMMMPTMDGYELLAQLRQNAMLDDLRIIGLSARAQNIDREKALVAGCWRYMTKPFDIDEVEQTVAEALV